MRELKTLILIIAVLMDCVDSQYPDCVDCPDGSIPLSPLSYNIMRSNVFNGTQPSNEGCTNGAIVSGRVTIDCGQGTTLIDCDQGYDGNADYSNLSNYFVWNKNEAVGEQVFIVFRFDQQINISRITMFFWNSQSNSISVPTVRMYRGNYFDGSIILTSEIIVTKNSPSRSGDGQRRLNYMNDNSLQFQYLRIEINFNSEWVFLSEVQFCGNIAPYHITQPSTDNDVQIVSPTATMTSITCSLNITIPSTVIVFWSHNGSIVAGASNKNPIQTSHGTTLQIENPHSSDAGVYQCVFNDVANNGWTLRRNVRLFITAPSIIHPPNDSQVVTFTNFSSSVQLMCSLNVTILSNMTVTWSRNGTTTPNEVSTAGSTTTLVIRNPQPSDAGVYQCVFNFRGWMLRRNIAVVTSSTTTPMSSSTTVTTATTTSTAITTSSIPTTAVTTTTSVVSDTTATTSVVIDTTATSSVTTTTTAAAAVTTTTITTTAAAAATTTTTTTTTTTAATTTTATTTTTTTATTTAATTTAATTTAAAATIVTFTTASITDDSTITTTTVKFTSTPVASPSISSNDIDSNITGNSSDSNVGTIVAVIIVIILLVAIMVTILVIIFIWRRNKKSYDGFDKNSKQPPLSITGLSISEEDKAIAKGDHVPSNANLELQNRSTFDSNYKPEGSAELLVQSQGQTLSMINPEYQATKKSDPAVSEFPEINLANPRYSIESSRSSVFTDSINTSAFLSGKIRDSKCDDSPAPCTSIYADPIPLVKSKGPPVVSMDNIQEIRELGTGVFGKVILANTVGLSYQYLGIGNSSDSAISIKVAVKLLNKSPASAEVKRAFDKEIKFMSRLKDDNVIRLLGICTTGTPFIMMEYMENGDLNNYLQKFKLTTDTDKVPAANEITLIALVHISYQIASGMKYLSSCKFIHRDLASRNVLVGINYTIKIADFGMSQNLYSAYYCRVGGRSVLPIRWMAYECFFGKFSVKTDVWAFGITLWEIFTLCRCLPFNDLTNQQMVEDAIKGAKRKIPGQPENCPDDIYCIMNSCLRHDPSERAEFKVLCDQLYNYYTNIL